jgi:hypothetical protein
MRPAAKAILASGIVTGPLLFAISLGIDWWGRRTYIERMEASGEVPARADRPAVAEAPLWILDPPPKTGAEAALSWATDVAMHCIVAAFWAALISIPLVLLFRRVLRDRWASCVLSLVSAATLSSLAFSQQWGITDSVPSYVIFGIGGCMGLISIAVVDLLLPPNPSLERP